MKGLFMRVFMLGLFVIITMISCVKQQPKGEMKKPTPTFSYSNIEMDIPSSWKEVASLNLVEFTASPNLRIVGNTFGLDILTDNREDIYFEKLRKRFSDISNEKITKLKNGITFIEIEGGFYKRPSPSSKSFVLLKNHKVLSALIPSSKGTINIWLDGQVVSLLENTEVFKTFLESYRQVAREHPLKENGSDEIIASTLESLKIELLEKDSHSDSITGNRFDFSLFSLEIPDAWIYAKPESDMRLAEFVLKNNSDYRVVAFNFGQVDLDNKKMIEANISRWRGQFASLEKEELIPLQNNDFALVYLQGTYVQKPPMAQEGVEMNNYALLAGIIPTEKGPYYFRLEAPKEVALAEQKNFQYFLNSYEQDFASLEREVEDILETDDDTDDRHSESSDGDISDREKENNNVSNNQPKDTILKLSDFSLQIPNSWVKIQPSSSMRTAEFLLGKNSEYSVVVYSFGRASFGSIDEMISANQDRWEQQFTKIENKKMLKTTAPSSALLYLDGTFIKKPFPMAQEGVETPSYATLNGIINSRTGPYFFRLEAPADIIKNQIDTFINFMNSYEQ